MKAELPENNDVRLEILRSFGILDTSNEACFDDITSLTADICKTPIAIISFVEDHRQWFKSEIGLGIMETPIEQSICSHAILQNKYIEIQDTYLDPRTVDNSLCMGENPIRFYAGAILRTATGWPLGSLCVLDYKPRILDALQRKALRIHADNIMRQLELMRAFATEAELYKELIRRS